MAAAKLLCSGGDSREEVAEQLPQLLAMRRHDSSWQPCKVSLSSSGLSLVVDFEDDDSKDVILTKEEAIELLRICPDPLQGADCILIRQGDRVLATPKSLHREVFFEAVVEERLNARHSKKHCTCSFVVRWIGHVPGGETTALPLSAMMTMPDSRIDIHPAIEAFFSNVSHGVQAAFEKELQTSPAPPIIGEGGTPYNPTRKEAVSSTQLLKKNIAVKKESASSKKILKNCSIVRKLFQNEGPRDAAGCGEDTDKPLIKLAPETSEEDSPESNASEDVMVAAPMTTLHSTGGDASGSRSNGDRVKRKLFSREKKQNPRKSPRLLGSLPRTRSQHKK